MEKEEWGKKKVEDLFCWNGHVCLAITYWLYKSTNFTAAEWMSQIDTSVYLLFICPMKNFSFPIFCELCSPFFFHLKFLNLYIIYMLRELDGGTQEFFLRVSITLGCWRLQSFRFFYNTRFSYLWRRSHVGFSSQSSKENIFSLTWRPCVHVEQNY